MILVGNLHLLKVMVPFEVRRGCDICLVNHCTWCDDWLAGTVLEHAQMAWVAGTGGGAASQVWDWNL